MGEYLYCYSENFVYERWVKKNNYGTFSSIIFWVLENQVSLCRMKKTVRNMEQIKKERKRLCSWIWDESVNKMKYLIFKKILHRCVYFLALSIEETITNSIAMVHYGSWEISFPIKRNQGHLEKWVIPGLRLTMFRMIQEYLIIPDRFWGSYQRLQGSSQKDSEANLRNLPWSKMGQFEFQKNNNCNKLKPIKYL